MRELRYNEALNEALRLEMIRDQSVILMGEDIAVWGDGGGVFGVTRGLAEQFGIERVRDTPISEESFVGLAVGAAMTGLRPVVELMYSDFLTLAMEPLVNQAAKMRYMFGGQARVPLVLRTNLGASGGKAAQHSQSLETMVAHIPGLKVVMPSTAADAKGMLIAAIRDENPVVFFEHKLLYFTKGEVPDGEYETPLAGAVVRRKGRDATVVATQALLLKALSVAERLSADGVEVEVIDLRSLVPLDVDSVVESVARTHRLLICHEAVGQYGWAGEIAMQVMEHAFFELDAPILRVCSKNYPVPYSQRLEDMIIPGEAEIEAALAQLLIGSAFGE
jgi:acetoin:2,6-dichlorophenolindophenol oxidoreductase subunit beta